MSGNGTFSQTLQKTGSFPLHVHCPSGRWGNTGQLDKLSEAQEQREMCDYRHECSQLLLASQARLSPEQAAVFMLSSPSDLPTAHTHTHRASTASQ